MKLTLLNCGNSTGIRIPDELTKALGVETGDEINAVIEGNKVILEKVSLQETEELTIEDLFKDYQDGSFKSDLIEFDPIGNEKW